MNTLWFALWAAPGVVGYLILRRDPGRFTFDNPLWITASLIAMASLFPLWGGPVFLALVLALPSKRICLRCRHTMPKTATVCPHCGQLQDLSPAQIEELAPSLEPEREEFAAPAKRYERWYWFSSLLGLVGMVVATLVWWAVLDQVAHWRVALFPRPVHMLVLPSVAWALPAGMFGIVTGEYAAGGMLPLLMGRQRYQGFRDYQRLKSPVDPQRAANVFFSVIVILTCVAVWVMMNWYTLALPDALVIHRPLALSEQRYSYHEVVAIRRSTQFSPSPGRVAQWDHPLYVVEFADGRRWSTRWEPGDRDPRELAALVDYIAQESGMPVQDMPVLYASDL